MLDVNQEIVYLIKKLALIIETNETKRRTFKKSNS